MRLFEVFSHAVIALAGDEEGGVLLTSLDTVLPAVLKAVRSLPEFSWDLLVADTECNSTVGPLAAVDMVYRQKPNNFLKPNLFLGPVCPYVLSPVSRFSSIWGIPVFTTSGMNAAFREKKTEYRLLTCLAGDYQQFSTFLIHILGTSLTQQLLSNFLNQNHPLRLWLI